jgi:hypothetical protein
LFGILILVVLTQLGILSIDGTSVNILIPKFNLTPFIAMFLNTAIKKEQFRFNYGRKWGKEKMLNHKIKLPIDKE